MKPTLLVLLAAGGCADELPPVFADAAPGECRARPSSTPDGGCPAASAYGLLPPTPADLDAGLGEYWLPTATAARPGALLVHAEMCGHDNIIIDVQLYPGKGGLPALVPGEYTIAPADASFATCGICVRLFTHVDGGGNPSEMYLARSGTLTLDDIGDEGGTGFSARLHDVNLRQVVIDPADFTTEDVGDCESVLGAPGIGDLLLRGAVRAGHDAVRVDSFEAGEDRRP